MKKEKEEQPEEEKDTTRAPYGTLSYDLQEISPFIWKAKRFDFYFFQDSELHFHGPFGSKMACVFEMHKNANRRASALDFPKISLHMSEEDVYRHLPAPVPNMIPKLLRGKTMCRKILSADYVQGRVAKRCPTCGRVMFIKQFQKHAIEGCKRGKDEKER